MVLRGDRQNVIQAGDEPAIAGSCASEEPLTQDLLDSHRRFKAVFESSLDVMAITDDDGICRAANPAASELLGEPLEKLIGRSVSEFLGPNFPFAEVWAELRRTRSIAGEHNITAKDGTVKILESRAVADIVPGQHLIIARDITSRKLQERELAGAREQAEQRAAQLQLVMSSVVDGIYVLDGNGDVVFANQAAAQILGCPSSDELPGCLADTNSFTLEGEPVKPEDTSSARALRGQAVSDVRYRLVTPYREIVVSASSSPIVDGKGRVIGAVNVFRDTSEEAAAFLRQSHIAKTLQRALMPRMLPSDIHGYRIAAKYLPALREAEVGGDFYDIFELGEGRFGVVIGDVTGKGLRAAITVASARYTIRSYAYLNQDPSAVLELANNALCAGEVSSHGVTTAFYAVVDTCAGRMRYANAGHEPPVKLNRFDRDAKEMFLPGMPLGVTPGMTYTDRETDLQPGDLIVMLTDGIVEARTGQSVMFEKSGVLSCLLEYRLSPAEEIAEKLLEAAVLHAGGQLQDDAAIVVVERAELEDVVCR